MYLKNTFFFRSFRTVTITHGFRSKAYQRNSLHLPLTPDWPLFADSAPLEKD